MPGQLFTQIQITMVFKLFLRTLAAVSLTGIFSHQYHAINGIFGSNLISISFLAILLCFYSFSYFYQFHQQNILPVTGAAHCQHQCHRLQWVLLILNIALTVFEALLHARHLSWVESGKVGFEAIFMIFTEYFLFLLAAFFSGEQQ